jgi:hypothetical protein
VTALLLAHYLILLEVMINTFSFTLTHLSLWRKFIGYITETLLIYIIVKDLKVKNYFVELKLMKNIFKALEKVGIEF